MTDNTVLNTGTGGDTVRTIDRSVDTVSIPAKTQVVQIDVGGENNESLVGPSNPVPVFNQPQYEILRLILAELRVISVLMQEGFSVTHDDLESLRRDAILNDRGLNEFDG